MMKKLSSTGKDLSEKQEKNTMKRLKQQGCMQENKGEIIMTERELAITIRVNQFDLVVLQDIKEGRIILPEGTKLIIGDTTISVYSQGWTTKKPVRVAGYWIKQKSGREVFKIIRAVKYLNGRLQYDEIDKEYLINPWFAIGRKEYQF